MSAPVPPGPVFDGRPLESLKKPELVTLCASLGLEPPRGKETKPELFERVKLGLHEHELEYIKDVRFSHFYIYKEGGASDPRKNSADKRNQDQQTLLKGPTPTLKKLLDAKLSLDPPGQRVARGLLSIPYGSSDDDGEDKDDPAKGLSDNSSREPSPSEHAVHRKQTREGAPAPPPAPPLQLPPPPPVPPEGGELVLRQHGGTQPLLSPHVPPGMYDDPFMLRPLPDPHDVSVHLHFPNVPVEEVPIHLDHSVEDIPFGLVDDPLITKSALLTDVVPKVLEAHTPLKNTRGILKAPGRDAAHFKYLGSLDKISSGDYSKFRLKSANTQGIVEVGGTYKLDLWVFPEETGGSLQVANPNTQPPRTAPGEATAPATSTAQIPAKHTTQVARNVDTDKEFIAWLREQLQEYDIAMPDKKLPGDTIGQVTACVRLYDAAMKVLDENGWRISLREGWKVPESFDKYAGCQFTLLAFFDAFYMGRSQGSGDFKLFRDNFHEHAHAELQEFREDPKKHHNTFNKMSRAKLDEWKKDRLVDYKQQQRKEERAERRREDDRQQKRERRRQERSRERGRDRETDWKSDRLRRDKAHDREGVRASRREHSAGAERHSHARKRQAPSDLFSDEEHHASRASGSSRHGSSRRYQEIDDDEDDEDDFAPESVRNVRPRLTSDELDN